jgi:FAD/FMN-containing dehydrogenase
MQRRTAIGLAGGAGLLGLGGLTVLGTNRDSTSALERLRSNVRGKVLLPEDQGYDAARASWNLNVDHHPRVVVAAAEADDVVAAVQYAAEERLATGVQAVGHDPAMEVHDALLINTRGIDELSVDPDTGTARVGAGVTWRRVIDTAVPVGLAPLNGSTSGLCAVGYLTGGGLPVLGRTYGYGVDRVRSLELVTADGRKRTASATEEPDLFWAVRGAKSNFGIVTSVELELLPQARFYGGGLMYPAAMAEVVLRGWLDWSAGLPDEMTTSMALMRFPDVPDVPAEVRGQFLVHVRVAHVSSADTGERLLRPMRDLGPVMDTVTDRPYTEVDEVHQDPLDPLPAVTTSSYLGELDDEFVREVIDIAGPGADLPPGPVEIRRLGGALGRRPTPTNAIGRRDAAYLFVLATATPPGEADPVRARQDGIMDRLRHWTTAGTVPNFLGDHADEAQVRATYLTADYDRLRSIKAAYDPDNMFRITHNIPPQE